MSKKETIEKYCKGCTLKDRVLAGECNGCVISSYGNNDICPCVNCLVKPSCNQKHTCNKRLSLIPNMRFRDWGEDHIPYVYVYELGEKQRSK